MSQPEPSQANLNSTTEADARSLRSVSHSKIALVVVGFGNIAQHWLHYFAAKLPASIQVCAIFNSSGAVAIPGSLPATVDVNNQQSTVAQLPLGDTETRVAAAIQTFKRHYAEVAILDLTASKTVSRFYPHWVARGAHLISANKYAGSSSPAFYQQLREALSAHKRQWLYNTTVGAGLPIQRSIQERLLCGDEIRALEGNFSGSLSWIFQQYRKGDLFSTWLREAAALGMTEPDPRIDLSGMDVARKLLILARESGWQLQLADINIESLVPAELKDLPLEEFWQQLETLDAHIGRIEGGQFHYLGRVEKKEDGSIHAFARLEAVGPQSAYANLAPGNANFMIHSRQYDHNPLVIQGPGAGKEVTAAGIHSDVLHLAQDLL
ncbi:MAG: hypothetical protein JJU03_12160 [Idiomarina sp.]|nr:hypothetical protein [Idiomarina sp.]